MARQLKDRQQAAYDRGTQQSLGRSATNVSVNMADPGVSHQASNILTSLGQIGGNLNKQRIKRDHGQALADYRAEVQAEDPSDAYVETYEFLEGEASAGDLRRELDDFHTKNADLPEAEYMTRKREITNKFVAGKSKHWMMGLAKHGMAIEDSADQAYYEHHKTKLAETQLDNLRKRAEEKLLTEPEHNSLEWREWLTKESGVLGKLCGITPEATATTLVELLGEKAKELGQPELLNFTAELDGDTGLKGTSLMHTKLRPRIVQLRKAAVVEGAKRRTSRAFTEVQTARTQTDGSYDMIGIESDLDAKVGSGALTLDERNQVVNSFRASYRFNMEDALRREEKATKETFESAWDLIADHEYDKAREYINGNSNIRGDLRMKMVKSMQEVTTAKNKGIHSQEYARLNKMILEGGLSTMSGVLGEMGATLPQEMLADLKWTIDEVQGPHQKYIKTIMKYIEDSLGDATLMKGHSAPALKAILQGQAQFRQDLKNAEAEGKPLDLQMIINNGSSGYLETLRRTYQPGMKDQQESLIESFKFNATINNPKASVTEWTAAMDQELGKVGTTTGALQQWTTEYLKDHGRKPTPQIIRNVLSNEASRGDVLRKYMTAKAQHKQE